MYVHPDFSQARTFTPRGSPASVIPRLVQVLWSDDTAVQADWKRSASDIGKTDCRGHQASPQAHGTASGQLRDSDRVDEAFTKQLVMSATTDSGLFVLRAPRFARSSIHYLSGPCPPSCLYRRSRLSSWPRSLFVFRVPDNRLGIGARNIHLQRLPVLRSGKRYRAFQAGHNAICSR